MSARIVAGVDLAFRRNASALVVASLVQQRIRVSHVREWRPSGRPLIPSVVCAELAEEARSHGATEIVADGHYVETLREHVRGLGFIDAPPPSDTWQTTARAMREGLVECIPHDRLRVQLEAVRFTFESGGRVSVQQPVAADGSHGDIASAFNLAVWRAAEVGGIFRQKESGSFGFQLLGGRRKRLSR